MSDLLSLCKREPMPLNKQKPLRESYQHRFRVRFVHHRCRNFTHHHNCHNADRCSSERIRNGSRSGYDSFNLRYTAMIEGSIAATIGCYWLIVQCGPCLVYRHWLFYVFTMLEQMCLRSMWMFHRLADGLGIPYCDHHAVWFCLVVFEMIIVHALKRPLRVPKHVPWGLYLCHWCIGTRSVQHCPFLHRR